MIELKHITEGDTKKVLKYITNPKVSRFLTWSPYKDEEKIRKYFDYAIKCRDFPDEIFCIFFNGEIIGTAHLLNRDNESMQIGFGILPEFWGHGLGYETAIEIIQYIRNSKWSEKIKHVLAVIHQDNIYAQKISTKLNFHLKQKNIKNNFDQYMLIL